MKVKAKCEDDLLHPPFPLPRYCYFEGFRAYYPFGNTPAEDLLENCATISHASVLCLGCGDLRSFFYTLWKNFNQDLTAAPKRFDSVSFTLNDYAPAISARNILFLYMCLKLPEEIEERKKWLCAMWAIWYCHELHSCHLEILNAVLAFLLSFSASTEQWFRKENPLHSLVSFTSPESFVKIVSMWKLWKNKTNMTTTRQEMYESRRKLQGREIKDYSDHSINLSKGHSMLFGDEPDVILKKGTVRAPEVAYYLDTGNCYAEAVLNAKLPSRKHTELNLTFFERKDWQFTCHFGLVPFESYFQAVEFTPKNLRLQELDTPYSVYVPENNFKSKPFLANSFQQFSLWVQSSSRVLNCKDISVSFNFDTSEATAFCQQLLLDNQKCSQSGPMQVYDIIHTSNLMDHRSPTNLVLVCAPLLKKDGVLEMTCMRCKNCTNTGDELLSLLFGFSSSMFPLILGVRCISHEGPDFTNPTKINPSPPDISHLLKVFPHIRRFLWVRELEAQKFIMPKLPPIQEGNITEALVNMFGLCSFSFLNHGPGDTKHLISHNCVETAAAMLSRFVLLQLENSPSCSYAFWEHLCKALKVFGGPYLHSMQTQLLLRGIHAHLTLSERDCPLCQQKPVSWHLAHFSCALDLDRFAGFDIFHVGNPHFMAIVHGLTSTDPDFLLDRALNGGDVHIFDSFDGVALTQNNLKLNFFAPLSCNKYKVTILLCYRSQLKNCLFEYSRLRLEDLQVPWVDYSYQQTEQISKPLSQSNLGTLLKYICDNYKMEAVIDPSESALQYLSSSNISTKRISSFKIMLHCKDMKLLLHCIFPVDFSSLKISCDSKGHVTVSCLRQPYSLEDERPCFIVSPDHPMALLKIKLQPSYITKHGIMQMTQEEARSTNDMRILQLYSTKIQVRFALGFLFTNALRSSFFILHTPDNVCCCLIVVNNVLLDYQHKTPALDLAYYFVNDFDANGVFSKWNNTMDPSKVADYTMSEPSLICLKEVFRYFRRRTNATLDSCSGESSFTLLQKFKISYAFSRCVLYLLLQDPDKVLYGSGDPLGIMTPNVMPAVGGVFCCHCRKLSFTTKKCRKCKEVSYCSKSCQTNHWPTHKRQCQMKAAPLPLCQRCKVGIKGNITAPDCMCSGIQYCSTKCLKLDGPNHRGVCKSVKVTTTKASSAGTEAFGCPSCEHCGALTLWSVKCTSCDEASYCDDTCLTKDWPKHKTICKGQPRRKEASSKRPEVGCALCHKSNASLQCLHCGEKRYCSESCWRKDWPQHKDACQDKQSSDLAKYFKPSSRRQCHFCRKVSNNMRECTGCYKVQYCQKACQEKDWPDHKASCASAGLSNGGTQQQESRKSAEQLCSYCLKASSNLKKCTKCGTVQYCNRSCQAEHWPKHRNACREAAKSESPHAADKCAYCMKSAWDDIKCSKCSMMQYCSFACRDKHWREHRALCSHVHEQRPAKSASCLVSCFSCGSARARLLTCKKCGKAKYCGRECQLKHWKEHKLTCSRL